jgi:hypothetical protein
MTLLAIAVIVAASPPASPVVDDNYLRLEATAPVSRPTDAALLGEKVFVLERRGDVVALDPTSLETLGRAKVRDAIAIAADPEGRELFVLGMTRQRGPWQTVYSIHPDSLEVTALYDIDQQVAFNEHGVGFATAGGEIFLNARHERAYGGVLRLDQRLGAVVGSATLSWTRSPASPLDDRLLAQWNATRLRLRGNKLYALGMVSGQIDVLDLESLQMVETLSVADSFPPPRLDGNGAVLVVWAAFDLVPLADGSVFVLENRFDRQGDASFGTRLGANGERDDLRLSTATSSNDVLRNYDSAVPLDGDHLLILSFT